jgi:transposase
MALPGVGKLMALTLVAEIGDIGRFPTARMLCAWAGLTAQVRNSDRKVRHGRITKQGSPCRPGWRASVRRFCSDRMTGSGRHHTSGRRCSPRCCLRSAGSCRS